MIKIKVIYVCKSKKAVTVQVDKKVGIFNSRLAQGFLRLDPEAPVPAVGDIFELPATTIVETTVVPSDDEAYEDTTWITLK